MFSIIQFIWWLSKKLQYSISKNTFDISSKDLVDEIIKLGKEARYVSDFDEIVSILKDNVKERDLVLTLGAGTVTEIGPMLLK